MAGLASSMVIAAFDTGVRPGIISFRRRVTNLLTKIVFYQQKIAPLAPLAVDDFICTSNTPFDFGRTFSALIVRLPSFIIFAVNSTKVLDN